MKFHSDLRKSFGDNHRQNYAAYNKSSIFEPVAVNHSNEIKRNIMKTQSKSSFVPKLHEETPFNRKLKEFWSKDEYVTQYGTPASTRGYFEKEFNKTKILNNQNTGTKFENHGKKNPFKTTTPLYEKNSNVDADLQTTLNSAKDKRINDLNSNIFNDKVINYINMHSLRKTKIYLEELSPLCPLKIILRITIGSLNINQKIFLIGRETLLVHISIG